MDHGKCHTETKYMTIRWESSWEAETLGREKRQSGGVEGALPRVSVVSDSQECPSLWAGVIRT